MKTPKYKIDKTQSIEHKGRTLYRIIALCDDKENNEFRTGDMGGYVQSEHNLSQSGFAWITDNAKAYDNARIEGHACLTHNAEAFNNALIKDRCYIKNNTRVYGNAVVQDVITIQDNAQVFDNAFLDGTISIGGTCKIHGDIRIEEELRLRGDSDISDRKHYLPIFNMDGDLWAFARTQTGGIDVTLSSAGRYANPAITIDELRAIKYRFQSDSDFVSRAIELAQSYIQL